MLNFLLVISLNSIFLQAHFDESFLDKPERSRLKAIASILQGDEDKERLDLTRNRIYLNPEKIIATDRGLLYSKRGEEIFLPELFSDYYGCFVRCTVEDLAILGEIEEVGLWWCHGCRRLRKMDKHGCCCRCGRAF